MTGPSSVFTHETNSALPPVYRREVSQDGLQAQGAASESPSLPAERRLAKDHSSSQESAKDGYEGPKAGWPGAFVLQEQPRPTMPMIGAWDINQQNQRDAAAAGHQERERTKSFVLSFSKSSWKDNKSYVTLCENLNALDQRSNQSNMIQIGKNNVWLTAKGFGFLTPERLAAHAERMGHFVYPSGCRTTTMTGGLFILPENAAKQEFVLQDLQPLRALVSREKTTHHLEETLERGFLQEKLKPANFANRKLRQSAVDLFCTWPIFLVTLPCLVGCELCCCVCDDRRTESAQLTWCMPAPLVKPMAEFSEDRFWTAVGQNLLRSTAD